MILKESLMIMNNYLQLSRGIRNTLKKEVDFSGYEFDKVSTAAKDFIRGRNKESVCTPSTPPL